MKQWLVGVGARGPSARFGRARSTNAPLINCVLKQLNENNVLQAHSSPRLSSPSSSSSSRGDWGKGNEGRGGKRERVILIFLGKVSGKVTAARSPPLENTLKTSQTDPFARLILNFYLSILESIPLRMNPTALNVCLVCVGDLVYCVVFFLKCELLKTISFIHTDSFAAIRRSLYKAPR